MPSHTGRTVAGGLAAASALVNLSVHRHLTLQMPAPATAGRIPWFSNICSLQNQVNICCTCWHMYHVRWLRPVSVWSSMVGIHVGIRLVSLQPATWPAHQPSCVSARPCPVPSLPGCRVHDTLCRASHCQPPFAFPGAKLRVLPLRVLCHSYLRALCHRQG